MTRRRDLEHHREGLDEIGEILGSMKTLAYMETRKLSRFLAAQQHVVETIEEVAADFLSFHPDLQPDSDDTTPVYLLIGSERGFCGNFNRAIRDELAATVRSTGTNHARVLAVGHKLHALVERDAAVQIDGASVAEDVPIVLKMLIERLDELQTGAGNLALFGVYHTMGGIREHSLLPPFAQPRPSTPSYRNPPLLNVSPPEFLLDLIDQYLLAALNHMLYTSLMVENDRRVAHLERAVHHIEDESRELMRKCRMLRQEEITEEIEVILLSASSIDGEYEAR